MFRIWSTISTSWRLGWLALVGLVGLVLLLQTPVQGAVEVAPASEPGTTNVTILASDDERVLFAVTSPDPGLVPVEINGTVYEQVVMEGYDQLRVPGQPDLPHTAFVVALPPGAVPVLSLLEQEQDILLDVMPAPVSQHDLVRWDGLDSEEAPEFEERILFDPEVYEVSALYPAAAATLGEPFWLRDQRVVSVMVQPVQVNPVEQTAVVNTRLVLEVRFTFPDGPTAAADPRPESPDYEDILRTNLLNYEQATQWRGREANAAPPQTSPCLANWNANSFRIAVKNNGIHQITHAELVTAGLSGTVNSNRIQMCYLNQEIAIIVEDGGDGVFGAGDRIVFYGQTIKTQETETNIYWLTVDPVATGLRVQSQSGAPGSAAIAANYEETIHLEEDIRYFSDIPMADLNDHWYWGAISYQLDVPATLDAPFTVNNLEPSAYMITVRAEVWGFSIADHHRYRILLNGQQVGPDQYFFGSGRDTSHLFEVQVASTFLLNGNNTLRIEALPDGSADPRHKMVVNWFQVDYRRQFVDQNDRIIFKQTTPGAWRYSVGSFATTPDIFEVTNPSVPIRITGAAGSSTVLFERTSASPATFTLSTAAARHNVTSITKDSFPNPRLQATSNRVDYLIITDPSFNNALTPLVNRRTATDGLAVRIVYVQDIFDEFGYGFYDTEAIRRFLDYTYTQWASPAPTYVLLVGEGSFDHRDLMGDNGATGNLMPVYLRSGIDYFLGETAADNQYVDFDGDNVADMMLGRLPAKTPAELTVMVNKIIAYETASLVPSWFGSHLFVTDNGLVYNSGTGQCTIDPAGNFFQTVEQFIQNEFPTGQFANRIFYAPTQCYPPPRPGHYAPSALEVQIRFSDMLNRGQNFVIYTGHSGVDFWGGGPTLITASNIHALTNGNRTPIMLPMTCLEGRTHDPDRDGFSETMLKHSGGGAVASYAPTGLQVQTGHKFLLSGFYHGVFNLNNERIGQGVMNAKISLYNSGNQNLQDLHDTFMLLGDPAMKLRIWRYSSSVSLPVVLR
ncbi:MAG: hypothetical protein KJ063_10970 [Anaerolineae bacterium]|nr:hypothetical protein [Anaerolineae bacterium]